MEMSAQGDSSTEPVESEKKETKPNETHPTELEPKEAQEAPLEQSAEVPEKEPEALKSGSSEKEKLSEQPEKKKRKRQDEASCRPRNHRLHGAWPRSQWPCVPLRPASA